MRASAAVVAAIAPTKATAAAEIMILRHMTYPPVPFLGPCRKVAPVQKRGLGADVQRHKIFSKSVSNKKVSIGPDNPRHPPADAITRNLPHQFEHSLMSARG